MKKWRWIGIPVAAALVALGIWLGLFLSGGTEQATTERPAAQSGEEPAAARTATAVDGAVDGAADGAPAQPVEVEALDGTEPLKAGQEPPPAADAPRTASAGSDQDTKSETIGKPVDSVALSEPAGAASESDGDDIIGEPGSAARDEPDGHAAGRETAREAPVAEATPDGAETTPDGARPTAEPPSFDVVRINPRGDAVIAGRAEPGSEVTVRDGSSEIGTVMADDRGEWVLLPDTPLESGSRELSLVESLPEGETIESDQVVVLSVPERESGTVDGDEETALAVLVPRDGEGASRVLQRPKSSAGTAPAAQPSFGIDALDRLATGGVHVSGRAAPGADVTLSIDGEIVGQAVASADGRWNATLEPGVAPGEHTVRAETRRGGDAAAAAVEMMLAAPSAAPGSPDDADVAIARDDAPSAAGASDEPITTAAAEAPAGEARAGEAGTAEREAPSSEPSSEPGVGASPTSDKPVTVAQALSVDDVDRRPDGALTVQGRASSNAKVEIFVDDEPIGVTRADQSGAWTFEGQGEPGAGGGRSLRADIVDPDDGTVVARIEIPLGDGPSVQVLQVPDEGVREAADGDLTVESVDYDETGEVTIAGQAEPGAAVNVYVDESYVGTAEAGRDGDWQIEPGDKLESGDHTLRVDKVDEAGIVLSRVETPLTRARRADFQLGDAIVVVQPGNSLWRIARRTYGGGIHFTVIYAANRAQIRDPNLIYPGQIFAIPRLN